MAPRKTMEDRISRIRLSGTLPPLRFRASTATVRPSRRTLHPKYERISQAAVTSESSGQLWSTVSPWQRTVAASGKELFFAP